ncbi:helix-turn-helix domain-containing protein [Haloferula sargassicola]|uniref:HTH cro/C1-type domain-containing protein n=1 Tax=Haloferula sargassicola TaxID=490096 RepID=A0ABP9UN45_9BACT
MPRPKGQAVHGHYIRSSRENAGLTQDALATQCGLTRALIQKAERGGPISASSISAVAAALSVAESALVVEEGWHGFAEERLMMPFEAKSEPKVGNIWGQPRETLYSLQPRALLVIATRSTARVLPAFSPKNAAGAIHLRNLIDGIREARDQLDALLTGSPRTSARLAERADQAYLAAGFARPAEYEDDPQAADAAFAVAIAIARVLDSLGLVAERPLSRDDPNYWRAVELATSACHGCSHASVYLKTPTPFLRCATFDTHDVRNQPNAVEVLRKPVWDAGQIPGVLEMFMARFIRLEFFDSASRIIWRNWAKKSFHEPAPRRAGK